MRHVAHLLADVVKLLSPEDRDVAAGRLAEACQGAQQCSFARAVIAENGVEFPAGKFRGDAAQRGKTTKLLDQIRDSDDGDGGGYGVSQRNKEGELVRHPIRSGTLVLRHALAGLSGRSGSGLRRVLRRALGLQLLGVENAIAPEFAIGQGLRVVLKSVGWGFGPGIGNGQRQIVFLQHEIDAGSRTLDRSRHYVSSYSQTLGVRLVPHGV